MFLITTTISFAEEPEIIGKTHFIATFNSLDGPGAEVQNLANTYDMSIFEFNWGGKQSSFNGSGITTNANFPLTDGEALTNNTHIGVAYPVHEDLRWGVLAELYGLIGDRTVGRVFGEELPWDNFSRENGAIQTPHFSADFYHAFLEGKKDRLSYGIVGGTLRSSELPAFSREEKNQVKLGSLVWRTPITNSSFFEKSDRKLEKGRHPVRGFDFLGDYEYADGKHWDLEVFSGATEPAPLSDLERDAVGGRTSVDIGRANAGFSYIWNVGRRPANGAREEEGVWAIDSSCRVSDRFIPFFTLAGTDYDRDIANESHQGNAIVTGALFKHPSGRELRAQFQRLDENYELMGFHKTEHYPSNFEGFQAQGTLPVTADFKIKGILYQLWQIDTSTRAGDTIFGDSYFPSIADSKKGSIGVHRLGADWKFSPELTINSYLEHAKFRKGAPAAASDIDKDVFNASLSGALKLTESLSVEGGIRQFFSVGEWQAMNFRSHQTIPEAALHWKFNKDRRVYLLYHHYQFEDNNGLSSGKNDYDGHQVILEFKALL
ncbi:MAG: hypothetical protein HY592_00425 [Candidatus Omnitrophica bacterium]|nr:hypothetical protein [Candidatus Omnitrophota bacterium]